MKEKYHNMSEHWVLGWYLKALYASKNFSENYTATMMQAGEFSPHSIVSSLIMKHFVPTSLLVPVSGLSIV